MVFGDEIWERKLELDELMRIRPLVGLVPLQERIQKLSLHYEDTVRRQLSEGQEENPN